MIPAALASQLARGLADFLRFSFASTTPGLEHVIDDFLATPGAILKGPYVSLALPFTPGTNPAYFPRLPLPFTPHAHQERAFERLAPRRKRSTLVATGTGSGKTECFLLPILDHCLEHASTPGIKAILVYPMNALATDQAKRVAQLIHGNDHLRGTVRAGLYIGQSKTHRGSVHEMTPTEVITDRELLQSHPPDILLTNYKMLDYLLLRPKDQRIWQHNTRGVLRFLVVDELHTFDGAQGTDLACLIRRLKRRLEVDDGSLCCVGTSATLGAAHDEPERPPALAQLRRYAQTVFGETFDADSVITESRLTPAELFAEQPVEHTDEPTPADLPTLDPARADDRDAWVRAQASLWLGSPPDDPDPAGPPHAWHVELGHRLHRHAAFRALVDALGSGIRSVDDLAQTMARSRSAWRDHPNFARAAVLSLLSLVSVARAWERETPEHRAAREAAGRPPRATSLLDVRLQLWQRELRRMVLSVGPRPRLRFSDDLPRPERRRHLPAVHCRDCGAMGWATRLDRDATHVLRTELEPFYRAYFRADPRVRFLFPAAAAPAGDPGWDESQRVLVDTKRLVTLDPDEPPEGEAFEVVIPPNLRSIPGGQQLRRDCPFCGARESLALVGFRAATLTSVHVDQLFASPFNEDKKLLTFSDSVQDASHRAGFFGARTWQTNLRIAMVHVLHERDGLTLAELARAMGQAFRERLDPVAWLSTFIAPNMLWLHDWDALRKKGTLPDGSDLPELVARRLAFEVVTELCLHANIGRSLPRTRSATAFVDPERLHAALDRVLPPVRTELPGMRDTSREALRSFLLGLLHALRQRGAVCHRELPPRYIESGGRDNYVYKQWVHLPSYGGAARMPALLSDRTGTARFDSYEGPSASNWYARWVDRCFYDGHALIADASSTYALVLPALVAEGLLVEHRGSKGERFWGIADEALRVTRHVTVARCTTCHHAITVAAPEADAWRELPCTTARCPGRYSLEPHPAAEASYFGRLYAKGDLQRIFSAEHTGLLDPHDRKQVELAFKAPEPPPGTPLRDLVAADAPTRYRLPWDPNLLSCTPTLEMGIDIGDLSSTFLCSVPPAQANYLQRIGRAGRRDGNSLVLTVANALDHDQYFYALPQEMMSGDVLPPGVFLDAAAVLERQLTAFCFDRWVATQPPEQPVELPEVLRDVFASVAAQPSTRFPYDLLAFVEREQATLLREFAQMFAGTLGPAALEHLRRYLVGGNDGQQGLSLRLIDAFHRELRQRDALRAEANRNRDEIKRLQALEAKPEDVDERIDRLEEEKDARIALARGIDNRQTLELLTDQGILPNYAFPESAVRLSSVIWRRKKEAPAKSSKYETWTYEYVRTPATALSELAPHAEFYAGGRHVTIDQVDVATTEVETWRFCDTCTHAERIDTGDPHSACPGCGSTIWRDPGQQLRMLRLRQVYANAPDRESRTRDDREERRPQFFLREMQVEVHDEHRVGAWQLQGDGAVPFGFEVLRRATFRDINFGEPRDQGAKTLVAGRGAIRPGFEICLRCGKVQTPHKDPEHTLACPSRKKGAKQEIEPCLYLYREFSSEALRLLLPMTDIGVRRRLSSFVAALQLGLRERFGGSVDHLRTTVYSEPVESSTLRRHYLVLFDTVPGGTGYISQLVTPDEGGELPLFQALELARRRVQGCACWNDPERDGCYRCLYGYRNTRDRDDTSASVAVQVLDAILTGVRDAELVAIDSIGSISITGLMDSVLEARFIEALRHATAGGKPARVQDKLYNGKHCHLLTLGGQEWMVEPQVLVEAGLRSRADFVLHPMTTRGDRKPIVVYLDGWEYHKHQIGLDLALRTALQAGGRYDVWSLTWYDLDAVLLDRPSNEEIRNLVHHDLRAVRTSLQRVGLQRHAAIAEQPILVTFFDELAAPEPGPWATIGQTLLACRMTPAHASHRRAWSQAVREHVPPWDQDAWRTLDPRRVLDTDDDPDEDDEDTATPAADPFFRLHAVHDGEQLAAVAILDDDPEHLEQPGFRATWNGVLNLFNLLRAVPSLWFVTRHDRPRSESAQRQAWLQRNLRPDDGWEGVDELHEDFRPLAQALMEAGAPQPQVGEELLDDRGDTWAEAELLWPDQRVAVSSRARVERARGEPAEGWRVFLLEDLAGDPSPILTALA